MPMVVSHKQRIFFRYEGDKGAFLLLHHGLLGRHQDWFDAGYVDELSKQFRLIIPDARGHGRSDHPDDPDAYSPAELADDMVAILDALDIRNTHFLGLSLGALVGFNLLQRYPERVRVTLLGGEVPFVSQAAREAWAGYAERLSSASLQALRTELRGAESLPDAGMTEEQETAAVGALLQAMCGWAPFPDERVSVRSPLALFCGDRDPALERIQAAVTRIARVRVIPLAGPTTHDVFLARDPLLELLQRYIHSGRKASDPRNGARDADIRQHGQHRPRGEQGSEQPGTAPRAEEQSAAGAGTDTAMQRAQQDAAEMPEAAHQAPQPPPDTASANRQGDPGPPPSSSAEDMPATADTPPNSTDQPAATDTSSGGGEQPAAADSPSSSGEQPAAADSASGGPARDGSEDRDRND